MPHFLPRNVHGLFLSKPGTQRVPLILKCPVTQIKGTLWHMPHVTFLSAKSCERKQLLSPLKACFVGEAGVEQQPRKLPQLLGTGRRVESKGAVQGVEGAEHNYLP